MQTYHLHHFNCPTCIAAGLGYSKRCPVGLPLWGVGQRKALEVPIPRK